MTKATPTPTPADAAHPIDAVTLAERDLAAHEAERSRLVGDLTAAWAAAAVAWRALKDALQVAERAQAQVVTLDQRARANWADAQQARRALADLMAETTEPPAPVVRGCSPGNDRDGDRPPGA